MNMTSIALRRVATAFAALALLLPVSIVTGTAAHVSPIIEVDERPIGDGNTGRITKKLQDLYFDVIKGKNPKYSDWCTPLGAKEARVS